MTDRSSWPAWPAWSSAVAATPVAALLPARHAWAAGSAAPQLVDALPCGADAVLIVQVGDDHIVVPGRLDDGRVQRVGLAHAALGSASNDRFAVQCLGALPPVRDEQPIDVDQTNESVILGDWVVKWQVRVQPSPALDRMRAIAAGVASGLIPDEQITPALRGSIEWHPDARYPIVTATQYLPESTDGWTWAVDLVRAAVGDAGVDAIAPFTRLGRMTGLMHVAFAAGGVSFLSDLSALHAAARADLDEAVALVDGAEGERLRAVAPRIAEGFDALSVISSTPLIPIHGDLHVGQVLRDRAGDLAIVDFDGSPVQSPEERLLPQPATRDIAGMLASINHVARVVNHRTPGVDRARTEAWIPIAQQAYVQAYRATLAEHDASDVFDERLLTPFLLQQECREFIYAARHLPHWRYVPDAVLTAMFAKEA